MSNIQMVFDYIDQYINHLMQEANIPGLSIALTDREKLLRVSTYGFADIAAQLPVSPETLFEIGSIGKSFTSLLLLQLQEQSQIDLGKPITTYLPWFQIQSDYPPITTEHLIHHTAGLPRGTELAPHGLYDIWALRERSVNTPPGEYWHYSSLGYKLLGFLLEELTGQSYRELVQTLILTPLEMTQTHPVITFETRQRAAVGYGNFYDDRPEHPSHGLVPTMWGEYGTGDGCQASTAEDMARYLRMLLNRGQGPRSQLVSNEGFNRMVPPGSPDGEHQYGYALVAYPIDDHFYIGHEGVTAGYMSHFALDMEAGLGVVFLSNKGGETNATLPAAMHVLTVLAAAHCDPTPPPPLPSVTEPSHVPNANDYVGTYRSGDRILHLRAEARQLLLTYQGTEVVLERRDTDRFYVGHPELELFLLEFQRDDEQVVEAFHGSDWYVHDRYRGPKRFETPDTWAPYPGHYRARLPECSNFRVVIRKGQLVLIFPSGTAEPLVSLGDRRFRVGKDHQTPEILHFHTILASHALRVDYSGCPYYRAFTP